MNIYKNTKIEAIVKQKVITTYEYSPLLFEILGFWKLKQKDITKEELHLNIQTPLNEYTSLIINGVEIPIPDKYKKKIINKK